MNRYGDVENFCRQLWADVTRLEKLVSTVSLPAMEKLSLEATINVKKSVYWDLVDSDLYRR